MKREPLCTNSARRSMSLIPGMIYEWTPDGMAPVFESDEADFRSSTLAPGAEIVPGYRLVERIGEGLSGEVWRAIDPGGVAVALKLIEAKRPEARRELRSLATLLKIRHPNIVRIIDVWDHDDWAVIGMELADETLQDRFHAATGSGKLGLGLAELAILLHQAARGIDFLNEARHQLPRGGLVGLIHGDIKPQNLLLVGGSVKVGDFGFLDRWDQPKPKLHPIRDGVESQILEFMAPELRHGHSSSRSDQYSLAVSYYYLRCGCLPSTKPEVNQDDSASVAEVPPDLAMLPHWERPAVARALATDPSRRWPSCVAFVEALIAAVGSAQCFTEPETLVFTKRSGVWKELRPATWLLAGATSAVLAASWFWVGGRTTVVNPTGSSLAAVPTRDPADAAEGEKLRQEAISSRHATSSLPPALLLANSPPDSDGDRVSDHVVFKPMEVVEPVESSWLPAEVGEGMIASPAKTTEVEEEPIGPVIKAAAAALRSWGVLTLDRFRGSFSTIWASTRARLATLPDPVPTIDTKVVATRSPRLIGPTRLPDGEVGPSKPLRARAASIIVRMPGPKAELVVRGDVGRGNPDEWYGPSRVIHTPPLDGPRDYLVGAFWAEAVGQHLTRSKQLRIEPGRRYEVDLRTETPSAVELTLPARSDPPAFPLVR